MKEHVDTSPETMLAIKQKQQAEIGALPPEQVMPETIASLDLPSDPAAQAAVFQEIQQKMGGNKIIPLANIGLAMLQSPTAGQLTEILKMDAVQMIARDTEPMEHVSATDVRTEKRAEGGRNR